MSFQRASAREGGLGGIEGSGAVLSRLQERKCVCVRERERERARERVAKDKTKGGVRQN
jgi:hypothetical protein